MPSLGNGDLEWLDSGTFRSALITHPPSGSATECSSCVGALPPHRINCPITEPNRASYVNGQKIVDWTINHLLPEGVEQGSDESKQFLRHGVAGQSLDLGESWAEWTVRLICALSAYACAIIQLVGLLGPGCGAQEGRGHA